jgi:TatA/E family protein of Tat protein translocase
VTEENGMPNLGPAEIIIILAIALVVFGPKKLPEIGKGIGNALREFNKARNDFMESLQHEERDAPSRSVAASASYGDEDTGASERKLEYPDPLDDESADALPYGSDFQAVEGDSQPSFRAADAGATPVAAAATTGNSSEDRKA